MIPLLAEVKVNLIDKLYTDLGNYLLSKRLILHANMAVHLNRSRVELVGLVIEKTEVAYLRSIPCIVVKKRHFKSLAELQMFRSRK